MRVGRPWTVVRTVVMRVVAVGPTGAFRLVFIAGVGGVFVARFGDGFVGAGGGVVSGRGGETGRDRDAE